ncbi:hypothetical protein [Clostridium sp.]|uniref:hypothetical protein n=1 Tax=Clostridium sp. TaxID=1506 RepID=UPI001EB14F2D|nr:hypothetical protein [Clostridium sp.]MBS5886023.1 hypothetical protein [Clostridium sp.]
MSNTQIMLEEAIKHFGTSDIITKMLSQKRDKEIEEQQKELYKAYKEKNNVSILCN